MTTTRPLDRPAAIRLALRDLVAEHGFHGASMGAVARRAGVAAGTAYVHYESKEELVYATYLEIKAELSSAVLAEVDLEALPKDRFIQLWLAVYHHFAREPSRARFLAQLEESPFHVEAGRRLEEAGDPILDQAARPDLTELLVDLPLAVIYSFTVGMAVRLVASGTSLSEDQLEAVANACWRAVTVA